MSTAVNVAFCRTYLRLVMADVRKYTTPEQRKDAWVWSLGQGHWEFHGPGRYRQTG